MTVSTYAGDLFTVTYTLYKEAAGESYIGKVAVASVIHNRLSDDLNTYGKVCLKPKQFSCWNDVKDVDHPPLIFKNKLDKEAWDECYTIAKRMVAGHFIPIDDWNHYYNPKKADPSWGMKMKNTKVIDNHKFGTL